MTVIRNVATQTVLATRARVARGLWERVVGLLGSNQLQEGEALLIPSCRSIHTVGMGFAIDVVFLRRGQGALRGVIVKAHPHLPPGRFCASLQASLVIELPAGTLLRTSTEVGHELEWCSP